MFNVIITIGLPLRPNPNLVFRELKLPAGLQNLTQFYKFYKMQRAGPQTQVTDRISIKATNHIKSTLLSFLKVCLRGCYTKSQFYQISLFHQLDIFSRKLIKSISENEHFP